MEYVYEQLPIRILRSILRQAGGKIAESVSLGRNSNRDADRYWINSVTIDNNDKISSSRTIEDDFCKLDDGPLPHTCRLQIEEMTVSRKVFPQDRVFPLIDLVIL